MELFSQHCNCFLGGWLRVAFLDTHTSPVHTFDVSAVLHDDPAVAIEKASVRHQEFDGISSGISFDGLVKLRQTMGFNQMRFFCTKPGVKIDMVTTDDEKGRAVVDYFTSNSTKLPDACASFESYGNSELAKSCATWNQGHGKWGVRGDDFVGDQRLYGRVAHINGKHALSLGLIDSEKNKFRCDDYIDSEIRGGRWMVFVR